MALFGKKTCVHCGKEVGAFARCTTADDKVLCKECRKLAGPEFDDCDHTYNQFLEIVERYNENEKKLAEFKIDKSYYNRIFIDSQKQQIAITDSFVFKNENMYKEHPHVYDLKDLKFFSQSYEEKKSESGITGTTITIDFFTVMAFEDSLVPCPLSDVVDIDRKVKISGVFKKKVEGFYNESDLELFNLATGILEAKGIVRPVDMQKGDSVESLDKYAKWFKILFDLEKKKHIKTKFVNAILEKLTEGLGIMGSVNMPDKIRARFGK